MALKKSFPVLGGNLNAEYIRYLYPAIMRPDRREASILFSIYTNQAARDAGLPPVVEKAVRLDVSGDRFDLYFSNAVLSQELFIERCYAAAKAEPVDMAHASNISLADAEDVL